MNQYTKYYFFLFLGTVISTLFHGQQTNTLFNTQVHAIEAEIPQILDSAHIPGISIALIDKGELVWSKGFGVVNKESGVKVSGETIFPAASLGKSVFAYAVLKMVSLGKLQLDSAITSTLPLQYLEENILKGKLLDEKIKLITPRMILSHSSGLPNWRTTGEPLKTLFTPGERYSYSGEAYFLLQLFVEYIMMQPIEKVMHHFVFEPLAMKSSTYLAGDHERYTSTYGNDGQPVIADPHEMANVAHTFKTNATDYARFIIAVMNGNGLTKTVSKEMFHPQITTDICRGKIAWGLGFAIQETDQGTAFFQWGKSPDASGYFIGFKESGKAIVYFTNIANQGLRIGEVLVHDALHYQDPLFACFGVKQYNQ